MLRVPFIRENQDLIIERLVKRNIDAKQMINDVLSLDEDRRSLQTKLDSTLAESNALSKEIGMLFKSGQGDKANEVKAKTSGLKEASKELTEQLNAKTEELDELLYRKCEYCHQFWIHGVKLLNLKSKWNNSPQRSDQTRDDGTTCLYGS